MLYHKLMRTFRLVCLVLLLVLLPLLLSRYKVEWAIFVRAIDPVEEIQNQINDINRMLQMSVNATTPLEKEVANLANRIKGATNQINQLRKDQELKAQEIAQREEEMRDQYELFSNRIDQQYRFARTYSPLVTLLSSAGDSDSAQALKYTLTLAQRDQQSIDSLGMNILELQRAKATAEQREQKLASLQTQLDTQKKSFETTIAGAKKYQSDLQGKIAALTAQQQSIINARSGTAITSVGEVPLADDFNASIGYKSQAPGNSFAVFSFGGYTHRNGMSQYGAKARAESGQSVEDILKAYYPNATLKKDYGVPDTIEVQGVGRIPFEGQYLQGIYEMPGSWNINALKAQAIAARTFAIRHTNGGQGSICTTEACQVFKNSPKGGEWEKAVNETKGWVLVDGEGKPVSTQYASTHGAYSNTGGWDTTTGNGDGDWSTNAWEKKANSPWFYKSWYRNGYSSSGANCGRNHPWLSEEEMADILNAWIVRNNPNGADSGRILPVTISSCNVGGSGGDPYSLEEMRSLANGSGGAVTDITGVTTSHNSNAQTANVTFSTNRGNISMSGNDFKTIFNIRAPGYLRIPQSSFAFFNIEYKP